MRISPYAASLAGALLILYAQGGLVPGYSPDSVQYLACANNLMDGNGFYSFDGLPYTGWAPLQPLIIAFMGVLGMNPVTAPFWINLFSLAGIVFTVHYLLERNLRSRPFIIMGTLSMLMPAMFAFYYMAWSEPLFCLLALWLVIFFHEYLEREKTACLAAAGVMAGLACLQRYIGACLVMAAVLILLVRPGRAGFFHRIKECLLFGSIASTPVFAWMARNYVTVSYLTGPRKPSGHNLFEVLNTFGATAAYLIYPWDMAKPFKALLIFAAAGFVGFALKKAGGVSLAVNSFKKWTFPWTLWVMTAAYIIAIFFTYLNTLLDDSATRYIAVLYFGIIILAFWLFDRASSAKDGKSPERTKQIIITVCAAWLAAGLVGSVQNAADVHNAGVGNYHEKKWADSGTAQWITQNPPKGRAYSNLAHFVYYKTGAECRLLPKEQSKLDRLHADVLEDGSVQVIWFNASNRKPDYNLDLFMNKYRVVANAALNDGKVVTLFPS